MSQISCFRCKGTGKLPEYSWNKGGVCFTCGGDGQLNPLSMQKVEMHEKDISKFMKHVSTRDLVSLITDGDVTRYQKLPEKTQMTLRVELRERARKLDIDPKDYIGNTKKMLNDMVKKLEDLEDSMPKPWKDKPYGKYAEEIPVHWLTKFQGNSLRRDDEEMDKFAEQLKKEGLQDPVMVIIGQEDRRISIGEGNHRTFAFLRAGLDKVPVRVVRNRTNSGGVFYDKMDAIPQFDYVKGDLKPSEVFNTYYDGGDTTPFTDENLKKVGHDKLDINVERMFFSDRWKPDFAKKFYTKMGEEVPKNIVKLFNDALAEAKELGIANYIIDHALQEEGDMEWVSKDDGIVSVDLPKALEKLNDRISDEKLLKMQASWGDSKSTSKTKLLDDDDDLLDFDDLEDL